MTITVPQCKVGSLAWGDQIQSTSSCSYTSCYLWLWGGGQHSRFNLCRANSSNSCKLMVSTGGVLYSCSRVGYSALSTRLLLLDLPFCENSIARQFFPAKFAGRLHSWGIPFRPCGLVLGSHHHHGPARVSWAEEWLDPASSSRWDCWTCTSVGDETGRTLSTR